MGAPHISALDAQHCWIYAATGLAKRPLLVTSDGGQHWQTLALPDSPSATGSNIENLAFLNAQTGWATGLSSTKNIPWLYMTRDGGKTWRLQSLPLPLQGGPFEISIESPVFFGFTDGILIVSLMSTSNSLAYPLFYQTHDGGVSWQLPGGNALPGASRIQNTVVLSMKHWMVFDERIPMSQASDLSLILDETLDGGQSWRHTTPRLAYQYVGISTFVSSSIGWGLGNNMPESYPPEAFRDALLQTTDGGQTWQVARYALIW